MNKAELMKKNTEVYRFTIFDRNGVTTRRIDWLLRNREGLGMRYHLHEVLNIGYYTWTDISWITKEIEQAGTWHTTEGHADSFDPKRYLFDLSLLQKDKDMYTDDPHVDYYLGVTHHAYASKLRERENSRIEVQNEKKANVAESTSSSSPSSSSSSNRETELEIQDHLELAAMHLETRATKHYQHEFTEQRWGAMLTLGTIHDDPTFMQQANTNTNTNTHANSNNSENNFVKANAWFQLCKTFNNKQHECSAHLIKQYLRIGLLGAAVTEASALIRTKHEKRTMLNSAQDTECVIPSIALEALASHLVSIQSAYININISQPSVRGGTRGAPGHATYAKYIMLLSAGVQLNPNCDEKFKMSSQLTQAVFDAIDASLIADNKCIAEVNGEKICPDPSIQGKAISLDGLCNEKDLQDFITSTDIVAHPCGADSSSSFAQYEIQKECKFFQYLCPGVGEKIQQETFGQFIGAASITDIVHHVYGGNGVRVMLTNRPYRVLFAEYFHPNMVKNLMGYANSRMNNQIEITVVSKNTRVLEQIKKAVELCQSQNKIKLHMYPFDDLSTWLEEYGNLLRSQEIFANSDTSSSSKNNRDHIRYFDYVEYNGGASISKNRDLELSLLHDILAPDGVIGMTYFTKNVHTDRIRSLLSSQQNETFPPFSAQPARLVKEYLNYNGFSDFSKDEKLLQFLIGWGDEIDVLSPNPMIEQFPPSSTSKIVSDAYSRKEADEILKNAGFRTQTRVPASYSNPYSEFSDYKVKKFWAHGIPEETYLYSFLTSFRSTVYAVKNEVIIRGRATINQALSYSGQDFVIVDRTGTFSSSFQGVEEQAKAQISVSFSTRHYSQPAEYNLTYVVLPSILPCIGLLSSSPTFKQLLQRNIDFWSEQNIQVNLPSMKLELIYFLGFLEKIDVVSFLHNNIPESDLMEQLSQSHSHSSSSSSTSDSELSESSKNSKMFERERKIRQEQLKVLKKKGSDSEIGHLSNDEDLVSQKYARVINTDIDTDNNDHAHTHREEIMDKEAKIESLQQQLSDLNKMLKSFEGVTNVLSTTEKIRQKTNMNMNEISGDGSIEEEEELKGSGIGSVDSMRTLMSSLRNMVSPSSSKDHKEYKVVKSPEEEEAKVGDTQISADATESKEHEKQSQRQSASANTNTKTNTKKILKESHISTQGITGLPGPVLGQTVATKIKVQSSEELARGFRSAACTAVANQTAIAPWDDQWCLGNDETNTRFTSRIKYVCMKKLNFDEFQFKYISKRKPQLAEAVTATVLPVLNAIRNDLISNRKHVFGDNSKNNFCYELSDALVTHIKGYVNRIFHLSREPMLPIESSMMFSGAQMQLQLATSDMRNEDSPNDFAVVDLILKKPVLQALSNALLMSTIWFDNTNGYAYASHHDDGLTHEAFRRLAAEFVSVRDLRGYSMMIELWLYAVVVIFYI